MNPNTRDRLIAAAFLAMSVFAMGYAVSSCTEGQRAKGWGGSMTIDLSCGEKLFDVTWKESNLWYATRPMRPDESPETYKFAEESNYGVMEGTVTFKEKACK